LKKRNIIKGIESEGIFVPFRKETVEMNREEFVKDAVARTASFAALCRNYGISRPTGYMWLKRYENGENFSDRSHQTFGVAANKTPQSVEDLIVEARRKEPAIGAVKIKRMLENKGETDIPCMSTINAILKRNDLITPEASGSSTPYKRFEMPAPNDMWQCDFKGHYELQSGVRCHPLSVIDDNAITGQSREIQRLIQTRTPEILHARGYD
jgi:transposase-like protein